MMSSRSPPCWWWSYLENAHHSVIFVIEDVAVEHPSSRKVIESHDDADPLMHTHVHNVHPAPIRLRHAVAIEYLELKSVQVERMIPRHHVFDLPDFRRAEV